MEPKTFLSIGEQIYQALKERIIDNRYLPGTMIQIDKLASEFSVSSTPIRETLFKLDGMGLVTMIRNKGAIVSEIDERKVRDIWQFRILLETFAARDAVVHFDAEKVRHIKNKILYLLNHLDDFDLYKETDFLLHDMISKSTKNALVRDALENLYDHSRRIRYFAEKGPVWQEIVSQSTQEHLRIVEALEAMDAEALSSRLREHLTKAQDRTIAAIHCPQQPSVSAPPQREEAEADKKPL